MITYKEDLRVDFIPANVGYMHESHTMAHNVISAGVGVCIELFFRWKLVSILFLGSTLLEYQLVRFLPRTTAYRSIHHFTH